MLAQSEFASAMERYKGLLSLWTLATGLALVSNLLITTAPLFAVILFLLAAASIATAGISCAYVIARDAV